jgi:DNA-binding GntR family transcriptional regulator
MPWSICCEHRKRAASVRGIERSTYHKQILEAVKNRDADLARETMRKHLIQTRNEIESALTKD